MPIDKTDPTMRALAARLGDRKATAVALCTNVINMRGTLAMLSGDLYGIETIREAASTLDAIAALAGMSRDELAAETVRLSDAQLAAAVEAERLIGRMRA